MIFDTYERDFYLDMDKELPGPILRTQKELTEYLSGSHTTGESYAEFCKKYLGACDGHSTDRIFAMINDLYNDKEI
jgi:CDP-glycerol glycerophosphotransferase (TagB/SpsB family)